MNKAQYLCLLCVSAGNVVLENLKVKENALVGLRLRLLLLMLSCSMFLIGPLSDVIMQCVSDRSSLPLVSSCSVFLIGQLSL